MYRYLFVIDSRTNPCAASTRFCSSKLYTGFCNEETKTDYRVVFSCSIRHFSKGKAVTLHRKHEIKHYKWEKQYL